MHTTSAGLKHHLHLHFTSYKDSASFGEGERDRERGRERGEMDAPNVRLLTPLQKQNRATSARAKRQGESRALSSPGSSPRGHFPSPSLLMTPHLISFPFTSFLAGSPSVFTHSLSSRDLPSSYLGHISSASCNSLTFAISGSVPARTCVTPLKRKASITTTSDLPHFPPPVQCSQA